MSTVSHPRHSLQIRFLRAKPEGERRSYSWEDSSLIIPAPYATVVYYNTNTCIRDTSLKGEEIDKNIGGGLSSYDGACKVAIE